MNKCEEKLAAARVFAQTKEPYLAPVTMDLIFEESDLLKEAGQAMGVNRNLVVLYNVDFVKKTPTPALGVILIHEVWHVLRRHHDMEDAVVRKHSTHPKRLLRYLANLAQDAAINNDIRELIDSTWKKYKVDIKPVFPETLGEPRGLHSIEYFNRLLDDIKRKKRDAKVLPLDVTVMAGESIPEELLDWGVEVMDVDIEAKKISVAEAIQSGHWGDVTSSLQEWVESTLTPKVSWQYELSSSVQAGIAVVRGMDDYSYAKRSRRYIGTKVLYPGLVGRDPRVAVGIDTSGSMDKRRLDRCLTELESIMSGVSGSIDVVAADTKIQWEGTIQDASEVQLVGRGGTNMGVILDWATKKMVDILVLMTDGECSWPKQVNSIRKLIIMVPGGRAKWVNFPDGAKIIEVD